MINLRKELKGIATVFFAIAMSVIMIPAQKVLADDEETCVHNNTEMVNFVAASETADGYSGDVVCLDCGKTIYTGKVSHWSQPFVVENETTANCVMRGGYEKVIYCANCGAEMSRTHVYTTDSVDSTYHINTEVREGKNATCTTDGYEGDLYCTDCKTTLSEGKVIPAFGHNYTESVVKAKICQDGTLTKTCSRCGDVVTSTIAYPDTVTLAKTSYVYNGKSFKPAVKVKAQDGSVISSDNYTVTYSKNTTNAGNCTVTVKFKGDYYEGTLAESYKINQAANSISLKTSSYKKTATSAKQVIALNATAKSGKIVYKSSNSRVKVNSAGKVTIPAYFTGKATISLTTANANYKKVTKKVTILVYPAKEKITSAANTAKNTATVKWTKFSYANGYEIYYALNNKFTSAKKVTIANECTTSKALTKLGKNKTYYIRVRAYKNIGTSRIYGAFSATKAVKISK